jgi:hypothetical protein
MRSNSTYSSSTNSESDDDEYSLSDNTSSASYTDSTPSQFDQPVKITREDILEQLQELGYSDVSEDIIEEFMRELQNQDSNVQIVSDENNKHKEKKTKKKGFKSSELSSEVSSLSNYSDVPKYTHYESDDTDSESSDSHHDSASDRDTEEYDGEDEEEHNIHYREKHTEDEYGVSISEIEPKKGETLSNYNRQSHGRVPEVEPIVISAKKYSPPRLAPKPKIPKIVQINTDDIKKENIQNQRSPTSTSSPDSNSPKSNIRSKSESSYRPDTHKRLHNVRRSLADPPLSSRSNDSTTSSTHYVPPAKHRPKAVTYRKKVHDPVSRFHQLKNVWKKDKFLKNSKNQQEHLRLQVRKEMMVISGQYFYGDGVNE